MTDIPNPEDIFTPEQWGNIRAHQANIEGQVDILGRKYGYGAIMQAVHIMWGQKMAADGLPGSHFRMGPCTSLTEVCVCREDEDSEGHCDWCCGCGWLTKEVKLLIQKSQ